MKLSFEQPTTTQQLRYARESFLTTMSTSAKRLSQAIPTFVQGVREVSDTLTTTLVDAKTLEGMQGITRHERKFLELVATIPYQTLREIGADAPDGFKTTFLHALEVLLECAHMAVAVKKDVLDEQVSFLARIVSDDKALGSGMNFSATWGKLIKAYEAQDAKLQALFKGREGGRMKVGDVIERNRDWADVLQASRRLQSELERIDVAEYKNLSNQCAEYMELIGEKLTRFHDQDPTRSVSTSISEGAYLMAEAMRFVSGTYYRALQVCTCIDNTALKITNAMG